MQYILSKNVYDMIGILLSPWSVVNMPCIQKELLPVMEPTVVLALKRLGGHFAMFHCSQNYTNLNNFIISLFLSVSNISTASALYGVIVCCTGP